MKPKLLILSSVLLVGGLIAGRTIPSSSSRVSDETTDGQAPMKSENPLKSSRRSTGNAEADGRMKAIRNAKDEPTRIRSAIELARTLPIGEAARWLDEGLFSQREGYALTLFTKILNERWKTEDPDGYLVYQLGKGQNVPEEDLARLTSSNPDLLVDSIARISDVNSRIRALSNLAKARPDLALAEIAKMDGNDSQPSYYLGNLFSEIVKQDEALLQANLDKLPATLRTAAVRAIYGSRLGKDFAGTLPELYDLPGGFDVLANYDLNQRNQEELLANFADFPAAWKKRFTDNSFYLTAGMKAQEILTMDWESLGLTERQAGELKGQTLFQQVREKPENLVSLFQDANLNELGVRRCIEMLSWNEGGEIIKELLPHLEGSNRTFAEGLVNPASGDEPGGAMHGALTGVAIGGHLGAGGLSSNFTSAGELVEQLAQTDQRNYGNYSYPLQNLSPEERERFLTDYTAMQGEDRHRISAVIASSERAFDLETRAAAAREILASPEATEIAGWNDEGAASQNVSRIAVDYLMQDPSQATSWATGLPEGEPRTWALKNIAANWRNYDPVATDTWIDSLPASEQTEVRSHLDRRNP